MKLKSWELWYSLFNHPLVYSPLFKNYLRNPAATGPLTLRQMLRKRFNGLPEEMRGLVFIGMMALTGALCLANITPMLRIFSSLVALALILLFMLSAILPGLNLALKVSAAIYSEQRQGRYDLLALTLSGAPALHWALVMRCLKEDFIARRLRELMLDFASMFIVPMVAGLITAAVIALLMILFDFYAALEFFAIVSVPLLFLLTFYSDYVQSTVTAALISIIVPTYLYTRSGFWMSWAAPLLFLGLQVVFYSAFLLFLVQLGGWVIRPDASETGIFLEAVIGLLTLFGLREVMIGILWSLAMRQFADDLQILRLD